MFFFGKSGYPTLSTLQQTFQAFTCAIMMIEIKVKGYVLHGMKLKKKYGLYRTTEILIGFLTETKFTFFS